MALIALGVTGGIGAYKAVEVCRGLQQRGHEVVAVMTEAATRFVGPLTFEAITRRPVITSQWNAGANADIVKAAVARSGNVMFFSRQALPFFREQVDTPVYRQTGIMAFTRSGLLNYVELPETPLERAESVDMLRLLEHGLTIRGVVADCATQGVDRAGDDDAVERLLVSDPNQTTIHERVLAMSGGSK